MDGDRIDSLLISGLSNASRARSSSVSHQSTRILAAAAPRRTSGAGERRGP